MNTETLVKVPMDTQDSLVDTMKQLQGARSQEDFARELGVSQQMISLIYNGGSPGTKVLRALRSRYPETKDAIDRFLSSQYTNISVSNTVN